ncbi:6311_t:CDS:2 [Cetraspora pellucida]|uniref:D-arabinono-1,4-lactone oxidase n=1 Tax=Cetraspora pellucida TaxID=1433469 RepID=A0A9N9C4X2_9GLOM|nr:6311_t:CDS:2 [Cetraspora pellucida]
MKYILRFLLIPIIATVFKSVAVSINKNLVIRSATPTGDTTWDNWNGQVHVTPSAIFKPSSLDDLKDIVKLAKQKGKTIRCAAQGHSVSKLSYTQNYLVIVTELTQVTVQKDPKYDWTVTAEAGTPLSKLDDVLRKHDPPLTLDSETVYDSFRVSGVIAVGAHGAKTSSGIMSDQLVSMQIVTASGDVVTFSEEIYKQEFNAAKVNLGLFGIIYSVTFRVQPMYNLRMTDTLYPAKEWIKPQNIKNILEVSDGIEIFYWPFNGFNQGDPSHPDSSKDLIWLINFLLSNPLLTPNITASIWDTRVAIAGNTSTVLQAPDAFHYVPSVESLKVSLWEIGFKIDSDFSNVATEISFIIQTVNFRIIKSTEALLSTAFNHDPKALYFRLDLISAYGNPDWEEFIQLLGQRYFTNKYNAKPHWGKEWDTKPEIISYLSKALKEPIKQFEKVRAKYDPNKMFFDNKSLQDIFRGALGPQS